MTQEVPFLKSRRQITEGWRLRSRKIPPGLKRSSCKPSSNAWISPKNSNCHQPQVHNAPPTGTQTVTSSDPARGRKGADRKINRGLGGEAWNLELICTPNNNPPKPLAAYYFLRGLGSCHIIFVQYRPLSLTHPMFTELSLCYPAVVRANTRRRANAG